MDQTAQKAVSDLKARSRVAWSGNLIELNSYRESKFDPFAEAANVRERFLHNYHVNVELLRACVTAPRVFYLVDHASH